jgi:copper chaperone CopZ
MSSQPKGRNTAVGKNASSTSTTKPTSGKHSEPSESKYESLLQKRKAERMSNNSTSNSTMSGNSCAVAVKAQLTDLKVRVAEVKIKEENGGSTATSSNGFSTPPRVGYTRVEWTEYFILDDNEDETTTETVVGVSIVNLYGLKDEVLGHKAMENGDMLYWPARMFYQNSINTILSAAEATAGGEYLKNVTGKPMIIMSRLADIGVQEPLLDFDETIAFLKEYINGRIDPSSSSSVKKTFQLNVVRRPLTAEELDSFIAISAKISR